MTQEEIIYQANVRMVLLYMLPDICEALMVDIDDYRKKAQVPPLRFREKVAWKGFLKHSRELRELLSKEDFETQESFADSCDILQTLLLSAVDRCEDNDALLMRRFVDYIQSFPSKRNIEIK